MNEKVLVQKFTKECKTPIEIALKYYSVILALGDVHLPPRDLELLAFIAVRGTISSPSAKEEFIRQFDSSVGTINNMTSRLSKRGLIIKQSNKFRIHPRLQLDLTKKNYLFNVIIKLKPDETS